MQRSTGTRWIRIADTGYVSVVDFLSLVKLTSNCRSHNGSVCEIGHLQFVKWLKIYSMIIKVECFETSLINVSDFKSRQKPDFLFHFILRFERYCQGLIYSSNSTAHEWSKLRIDAKLWVFSFVMHPNTVILSSVIVSFIFTKHLLKAEKFWPFK